MNTKIENTITDLVAKFLYYDRKEDFELPVGEIEKQIDSCDLSIEDMVNVFRRELEQNL